MRLVGLPSNNDEAGTASFLANVTSRVLEVKVNHLSPYEVQPHRVISLARIDGVYEPSKSDSRNV